MILQRRKLRFISCHEERFNWTYQLQQLVTVFNLPAWLLLIFCCVKISTLFANINFLTTTPNNNIQRQSFCKTIFELFKSMLDQYSSLFGNLRLRHSFSFCYAFAFIPLALLYLGNLYKGDNITTLTLPTPMIPFDTFESLVIHNFKIYSSRKQVSSQAHSKINKSLELWNK